MRSKTLTGRSNFIRRILRRRRQDIVFSMKLSLLPGGIVNLLYVGTKLFAGLTTGSFWFVALAVYYALLFSLRFYLLSHIHRNELGRHPMAELKKARNCGILLFVMGIALSVIVFFMVHLNRGYRYPGILIYAAGGYSVYSVISATVSLFGRGKLASPVVATTRIVKLTAALVSFLSLETAVLARFYSSGSAQIRRALLGTTGIGVCLVVITMSVLMIVSSCRKIRRLRSASGDDEL